MHSFSCVKILSCVALLFVFSREPLVAGLKEKIPRLLSRSLSCLKSFSQKDEAQPLLKRYFSLKEGLNIIASREVIKKTVSLKRSSENQVFDYSKVFVEDLHEIRSKSEPPTSLPLEEGDDFSFLRSKSTPERKRPLCVSFEKRLSLPTHLSEKERIGLFWRSSRDLLLSSSMSVPMGSGSLSSLASIQEEEEWDDRVLRTRSTGDLLKSPVCFYKRSPSAPPLSRVHEEEEEDNENVFYKTVHACSTGDLSQLPLHKPSSSPPLSRVCEKKEEGDENVFYEFMHTCSTGDLSQLPTVFSTGNLPRPPLRETFSAPPLSRVYEENYEGDATRL